MTEKEFENLKVGDKVWIYHGFLCEAVVVSKQADCVEFKADSLAPTKFNYKYVGITKSQALEGEIELQEKYVDVAEIELGQKQATLSALKSELAKAKEEEERAKKVWFVDFRDDSVKPLDKEHWERSIEQAYFKNKSYVKICDTEQEAYEAFSKHLERKLFKALEKCGYKFAIPWESKYICVVFIEEEKDDRWGVFYYPSHSHGYVRKQDTYDTLEEAEAELERRKK
jgi:hypothetical protein